MADTYYTLPFFHQRYLDGSGNPLAGGSLTFYAAGSTALKPIYLDQSGTGARNPMPLDSAGVPEDQYFGGPGEYDIVISDSDGVIIDKVLRVTQSSGSGGAEDTYKALIGITDPLPGYLYDKIVGATNVIVTKSAGSVGECLEIAFKPVVSATGGDVPGFLIDKISALNTPIGIESYNGKVNLTFDYSKISSNLTNLAHVIWFSGSNGNLVGTQSFTFGDPSRQAALFAPSIQASGSMIIGSSGNAFWDEDNFYLRYPANGGIVQLSPDSTDKYIYAHNNLGNASVVTDKASFANLANNGLVFACQLPNTSEDLIFLHTASGLSYNPTSNILTAPKLAVSNLSTAGVVVNDANGNLSTSNIGNFTDDHLVYVDSLDTTPGYLGTKLAAGTNIGFNVTTDSRGSKLWISARSNMLLNPTYVQANYTVVDTDVLVVNNSNNAITVTLPTPGSTYNGRLIIVTNTGSALLTINTVSGGIQGNVPSISALGRQEFRCLKGPDNNYYWFNR